SESQCLRIAWTLFVNYTPKNWDGYSGFKSDYVIPLRDFSVRSKEQVKEFLLKFVDGLALISKHYSVIIKPSTSSIVESELILLTKIINAGNIASYLPLMVASRIKNENGEARNSEYINLLKSLEMFSYRVFLWEGKRSNAGLSKFYRWSDDVFTSKFSLQSVTEWIYGTINWYSPENGFRKTIIKDFFDWYPYRRLLKYTLFEYELFLLNGKNKPKLNWEDLTDSTLEHILPQNPEVGSNWLTKWTSEERRKFTHDISNLVLTKDNSRYSNFEFERKKGVAGSGFSYSNSDIRQERKIAEYTDWTNEARKRRREELVSWIIERWGIDKHFQSPSIDILEDDEELIFNDID
ncbi:MAG: HNH endonuclease, partial [Flavobacterium sp.]